jgi:hypothetical protein
MAFVRQRTDFERTRSHIAPMDSALLSLLGAFVLSLGNMPSFKQLGDAELAAVASHVRGAWSNKAPPLAAELIAQKRQASTRTTPFAGGAELKALAAKP